MTAKYEFNALARMTKGQLKKLVGYLDEVGISDEALIGVASDPEGNEVWPLSQQVDWGTLLKSGMRFDMVPGRKNEPQDGEMIFLWPGY